MTDKERLDHFCQLASSGSQPNPSNGEQKAKELAELVLHVAGALDFNAVLGLVLFIELAMCGEHSRAVDLIYPKEKPQ